MISPNDIRQQERSAANPRLSIGLPVYNGERWLTQAIESLLGQTYGDFTLLISDNGSTDATRDFCEAYAKRDSRVQYLRHDVNRGVIWNWNWVFKVSHSEYFKWAACDDVYHPKFLESCIDVLDQEPDVVWCHTRSRHVDGSGQVLAGDENTAISYVARQNCEADVPCRTSNRSSSRFKAIILGHGGCLDCHAVIRSQMLRKTRLYLPYFGSEKVLMAEIALLGRHHEVPEILYDVRIHDHAAGNIRSRIEQRRFIDPTAKVWRSDRLGLLAGYLAAVHRAEIPVSERLRCYAAVGQYLLQVRKWKSLLQRTITGAGVSGPYPSIDTPDTVDAHNLDSASTGDECTKKSQPEMETV
jgi:glycosyltransferase involved in cell wall biosynthesis